MWPTVCGVRAMLSLARTYANVLANEYVMLSSLCLALYDWCITLDQEIQLVWCSQWDRVTVLWLLIRYVPILTFLILEITRFLPSPPQACEQISLIATVLIIVVIMLCHIAFALRTYALYHRSRVIGALFLLLLAMEAGAIIFVTVAPRVSSAEAESAPRLTRGCPPPPSSNLYGLLNCSIPFAYDAIVFALTLARSVTLIRRGCPRGAPIIDVLMRDGIGYFAASLACYLCNTLLYLLGEGNAKNITTGYSVMFPVVMTLRLTINLRGLTPDTRPPLDGGKEDGDEDRDGVVLTGVAATDSFALSTWPYNTSEDKFDSTEA